MRRLPALLAAVPLASLAGCTHDDVAQVTGRTVRLTEHDYRIRPQAVRVRPGRVTFVVRNTSGLPHNWQLKRHGRVRARILTLKPGATGRVTVRLTRGAYRMLCSVGHDEELGEHGTVSVR